MHSKKLWTITAALIIPSAFAAVAATPAAAQSFGADAVEVLHERGVLTGTGCAPGDCDGILLRWEAALWLARAFDLTAEEPHRFVDVPTEGTVAEAVSALHPAGIEARCASEPLRFCPDQRATRAEMATFLSQAIGLEADDPGGFHRRGPRPSTCRQHRCDLCRRDHCRVRASPIQILPRYFNPADSGCCAARWSTPTRPRGEQQPHQHQPRRWNNRYRQPKRHHRQPKRHHRQHRRHHRQHRRHDRQHRRKHREHRRHHRSRGSQPRR